MNRTALVLLAFAGLLLVVGVALFSPRTAVIVAAVLCAAAGVAQLDVNREGSE